MMRELLGLNGKTKICDFNDCFLDEDVGGLDIPVDDIFGCEVFESLKYLAHNGPDFFLSHRTPFLDSFL
jgi:hypothetical protein